MSSLYSLRKLPTDHLPLRGALSVGGWSIDVFVEQRFDLACPADDVFVAVVAGRLRLAVVDPALNAMLPGRDVVAARAWGHVVSALRSHESLLDAFHAANDAAFDADAGWMGGPMLCLAAVDLHPRSPSILSVVRGGDSEVHWDSGSLAGPCFTSESVDRLRDERRARGHEGADPRRWAVQAEVLSSDSYLSTPIGLTDCPRFETWGPTQSSAVSLTTDGAVRGDGTAVLSHDELLQICEQTPVGHHISSHGDRAIVSATWVG